LRALPEHRDGRPHALVDEQHENLVLVAKENGVAIARRGYGADLHFDNGFAHIENLATRLPTKIRFIVWLRYCPFLLAEPRGLVSNITAMEYFLLSWSSGISFFARWPVVLADASSKPSFAMSGRRQSPISKDVPALSQLWIVERLTSSATASCLALTSVSSE
jgi:hypothetical protein